jgi:hypothetical protein
MNHNNKIIKLNFIKENKIYIKENRILNSILEQYKQSIINKNNILVYYIL